MVTEIVTPRVGALEPPYEPAVAAQLDKMMPPGVPPIALFRTVVRNLPMAAAMTLWGSYELSRALSLSLRDREIVIDRTCARCGCEYEWGVHIAFFAEKARFDRSQVRSLTHGGPDDPCWTAERDRLLIRAVDTLYDHRDIGDALWAALRDEFDEREILDLTMLCGWYHAISFTARAARVPLEAGSPTFADVG
ncbi:carboxymuconolactone decarboxylase family protein [Mycobacterium sp. E796]|uniref:carboxymuconolactone decarboxylase family protein n=1 Tax=Mycobacterium sp. E796 TaxID=1834151 RepID=UPI0007FD546E|nr:carboxymuconolactone decarboxylase family protein [Mycobacterium sp. E796]OBI44576.1 carboxymuconolactone decarboxylase [Mycobacterium sp. E796]